LREIVISGVSTMTDSEGIAASEDSMATVVSAAGIERSAVGSESSTAESESSTAVTESSARSGVFAEASEAFTAVTAPSRQIAGSTAVKAAGVSFMVEGVAAMVVADPTAAQLMGGK
jgi:hypothetical protein